MKAKTWEDWKAAGFYVRKDEKAQGRDKAGRPTFTRAQVETSEAFDRDPRAPRRPFDGGE